MNLFIYDLECKGGCNGLDTYITSLQAYRTWGIRPAHLGKEPTNIPMKNMHFSQKFCCILCFNECRPHHTNLEHPQLLFNVAHKYYDSCNLCFKIVLTLA